WPATRTAPGGARPPPRPGAAPRRRGRAAMPRPPQARMRRPRPRPRRRRKPRGARAHRRGRTAAARREPPPAPHTGTRGSRPGGGPDTVRRAQEDGEAQVDEIDARDGEHDVAAQHHALVEDVVHELQERRVRVFEETRARLAHLAPATKL